MADTVRKPMTVEAFLAWEEEQDLRFELVDGHPYAMTGGTNAHDLVRVGIVSEFRQQLRNTPCRAQIDVKVVCPRGNVRYPDVQITCGPWDPRSSVAANPVVVVEVLSRSTQATDFIAKLADYESVPGIKAYALFWQDEPRAQVFRREGGRLVLAEEVSGRDSGLVFTDPDVRLALADVYDGLPDALETPTPA